MGIDVNSGTWKAVHGYLTERLARLRELNDRHLPESETALLRGQIKEVKNLLRLPDDPEDPANVIPPGDARVV